MSTKASNTVHVDLNEDDEAGIGTVIVEEDASAPMGTTNPDVINEDTSQTDSLPKEAVLNKDGSVTIPLFEKIEIQSIKDGKLRTRTYTELVFHRLKGVDMRKIADATEKDKAAVTFSCSTRIFVKLMHAIFDQLDGVDIANGGRVVNYFLTSGPKTGR